MNMKMITMEMDGDQRVVLPISRNRLCYYLYATKGSDQMNMFWSLIETTFVMTIVSLFLAYYIYLMV